MVRFANTNTKNAAFWDMAAREKELGQVMLTPHPDLVSTTSSNRVVGEMQPAKGAADDDVDMWAGIRSDFVRDYLYSSLGEYCGLTIEAGNYQGDIQLKGRSS
jgi:hypothetical protein